MAGVTMLDAMYTLNVRKQSDATERLFLPWAQFL